MSLLQNWIPPTYQNWELAQYAFYIFTVGPLVQLLTAWYPMGKTSTKSRWNIPGKTAWVTMETPGMVLVAAIMNTLPEQLGIRSLPWENWLLAGLFIFHYLNRAWFSPIVLIPSMAPIGIVPWLGANSFQILNGIAIGGWIGGYGPTTAAYWKGSLPRVLLGLTIFTAGFAGNVYHDGVLRDIRRQVAKDQKEKAKAQGKDLENVAKVYRIPEGAFFKYMLFPHYLCEWIEWTGFWIIGGFSFLPGAMFVLNELTTMAPRAINGKRWYVEKFGKEKVGNRAAIVPGLL